MLSATKQDLNDLIVYSLNFVNIHNVCVCDTVWLAMHRKMLEENIPKMLAVITFGGSIGIMGNFLLVLYSFPVF